MSEKKRLDIKSDNSDFIEKIKIETDTEKIFLLKIQNEIEKSNFNKGTVHKLTKNLSNKQKDRLKDLYIDQIKRFGLSTENYKKRIIKIRKSLVY